MVSSQASIDVNVSKSNSEAIESKDDIPSFYLDVEQLTTS